MSTWKDSNPYIAFCYISSQLCSSSSVTLICWSLDVLFYQCVYICSSWSILPLLFSYCFLSSMLLREILTCQIVHTNAIISSQEFRLAKPCWQKKVHVKCVQVDKSFLMLIWQIIESFFFLFAVILVLPWHSFFLDVIWEGIWALRVWFI